MVEAAISTVPADARPMGMKTATARQEFVYKAAELGITAGDVTDSVQNIVSIQPVEKKQAVVHTAAEKDGGAHSAPTLLPIAPTVYMDDVDWTGSAARGVYQACMGNTVTGHA